MSTKKKKPQVKKTISLRKRLTLFKSDMEIHIDHDSTAQSVTMLDIAGNEIYKAPMDHFLGIAKEVQEASEALSGKRKSEDVIVSAHRDTPIEINLPNRTLPPQAPAKAAERDSGKYKMKVEFRDMDETGAITKQFMELEVDAADDTQARRKAIEAVQKKHKHASAIRPRFAK